MNAIWTFFYACVRYFCLYLLKLVAKEVYAYGLLAALFLLSLLLIHPELSNDALVLSVLIVLASFWLWSLLFIWLLNLSPSYRRMKGKTVTTTTKLTLGNALGYAAAFIFLYLEPSLLWASLVLKLVHLSASSLTAIVLALGFPMVLSPLLAILWGIRLAQGMETIPIAKMEIERMGRSSLLPSFPSWFSHGLRP